MSVDRYVIFVLLVIYEKLDSHFGKIGNILYFRIKTFVVLLFVDVIDFKQLPEVIDIANI